MLEKTSVARDSLEPKNRPQKLIKSDGGRGTAFVTRGLKVSNATGSGPSQAYGAGPLSVNPASRAEQMKNSEEHISQVTLPTSDSLFPCELFSLFPCKLFTSWFSIGKCILLWTMPGLENFICA